MQLLTQDKVGIGSEQFKTTNQLTLDEPISTTIMRDLSQIGFKLKYVLLPKMREDKGKQLRNWDLWGPLLLCLMLALTLSISSEEGADLIFATIFVIIWVGAGVVTLNAKLLGGKISFFQSVCVLGYCVFPINITALLCALIGNHLFIIRLILVVLSFTWSTFSSVGFMATLVSEDKKILAVYPVFLFYLFLSWFSLIA